MAKLKAPLFSLGASGSIAKTLVYFPWKGINAVREHVVPTNPKTTAQQAQRAHMTAALTEFHGAGYLEADMTAWARLAGAEGKIMTGFNRMVKEFIDEIIDGNTWERITRVGIATPSAEGFVVTVEKAAAGNAPYVHLGVRKTYFPTSVVLLDVGGGFWSETITGLAANTLYYLYIDVGATGTDYGRTGVYMYRTAAA